MPRSCSTASKTAPSRWTYCRRRLPGQLPPGRCLVRRYRSFSQPANRPPKCRLGKAQCAQHSKFQYNDGTILAVLEPMRRNRPRAITSRKNRSGNGASGNTPSAMKTIGKGTWVTSITTPSSMVTPGAPESGHTVRSSDTYKKGGIQRIGEWRSQKALKESNMNKPTWLAGQMEQGQALDVRIRKNLAKVGFDV